MYDSTTTVAIGLDVHVISARVAAHGALPVHSPPNRVQERRSQHAEQR